MGPFLVPAQARWQSYLRNILLELRSLRRNSLHSYEIPIGPNRHRTSITESKTTWRKLLSGAASHIAVIRAMGGWCLCYSLGKCVTSVRNWVKPRIQTRPERREFICFSCEQWILLHIQDKPFCLSSSPSHFLAQYIKHFREKFIARRGPNLVHFLRYLGKPHL